MWVNSDPDPRRQAHRRRSRVAWADPRPPASRSRFPPAPSRASGTSTSATWRATVGKPLHYLDPAAEGLTQTKTHCSAPPATRLGSYPTSMASDAKVMQVPGDLDRNIGYIMDHGIAPNGGGTRVNQYTLIMDVMVDTTGPGAASMLQIELRRQHRRRRPVLAGQQLRPGHRRLQRHRHLHRRRLAPRRRRLRRWPPPRRWSPSTSTASSRTTGPPTRAWTTRAAPCCRPRSSSAMATRTNAADVGQQHPDPRRRALQSGTGRAGRTVRERHSGLHSRGTAAGAHARKNRKSNDADLAVVRHRLHA